jgi:hypothetical protein
LRNREMSAGAVGFSISYARMSPSVLSTI